MEKVNKREQWVDYTKTFACILVVIGHLLQGIRMAGIDWNNTLYDYINKYIYIFHMPLFMCLSGYLYGKYTKIGNFNEYLKFIKKKFINLSIPYIIFYISHVLINMLFTNSVNSQKNIHDILNILTNPIAPFWFLYALICLFIIIPLIENIFKHHNIKICITLIILHVINIFFKTGIYAIDIFMELSIYFYFGIMLLKYEAPRWNYKKTIVHILIFTIFSIIYCFVFINKIIHTNIISIIKLVLATYGTIISIVIFKNNEKRLKNIHIYNILSKYTFPIYLMHTIFSAGTRIMLLKLSINNFYLHVLFGFIMGIIMPIIVAKILEKTKYGNLILYPLNTIKLIKNKT